MPELLRDCILVPIPKGNKDPSVSDNYRPIALASTLSKALGIYASTSPILNCGFCERITQVIIQQ